MTPAGDPACPLCKGRQSTAIESVRWDDIVAALETHVGRPPPEALRGEFPAGTLTRLRCDHCGLEHSTAGGAGSPAFYDYVYSGVTAYDPDRWDFEVARSIIAPGDSVLDLGCGAGAFLASLPATVRSVGIDFNEAAVTAARARGVEARSMTPSGVAPGAFDVVCAFQTVEHVVDVAEVMDAALRCVRPGGRILVSVPNRERTPVNEPLVMDWPPHHLSRWAPRQLEVLGGRYGLEVSEVRLDRRGLRGLVRIGGYLAVMKVLRRQVLFPVPTTATPSTSLGGLRRRHTMIGIYRRPDAPSAQITAPTGAATPGS